MADRLLDAQVAYLLAELDDERIEQTVAGAIDDALAVAATVTLAEVAGRRVAARDRRARGARRRFDPGPRRAGRRDADAVYDNEGDYPLGETVDRDPVDALVAHVIGMRRLQDRALDRFSESPLVGVVASRFVTTILSDFVAQNRQRAEKLPGMGSLLSLGQSAASRMPGKNLLGDAAGRARSSRCAARAARCAT